MQKVRVQVTGVTKDYFIRCLQGYAGNMFKGKLIGEVHQEGIENPEFKMVMGFETVENAKGYIEFAKVRAGNRDESKAKFELIKPVLVKVTDVISDWFIDCLKDHAGMLFHGEVQEDIEEVGGNYRMIMGFDSQEEALGYIEFGEQRVNDRGEQAEFELLAEEAAVIVA